MKKIIQWVMLFLFLPLVVCFDIFLSKRSVAKKIIYLVLMFPLLSLIWTANIQTATHVSQYILKSKGIINAPVKVPVSGTSMMPAIRDGETIEMVARAGYTPKRGDIVSFNNAETLGKSYLKRIIGLPGEEVVIKNGYVFINGKALSENYTYNNIPTYGNTFVSDCEKTKVPENNYFVMGDNRAVSVDSRIVGFVEMEDIDQVIKTDYKEKFVSPAKQNQITHNKIDPKNFLKKLNEKRIMANAPSLTTHTLLNDLSASRAAQIKDNFATWKKKTFPITQTLEKNNYHYNLVHEYVTFGFYNEDDIVNQIMESPVSKDRFLSEQYTEVGIGVTEKTQNECTYPVISVILSWPSRPTYDNEAVDGWNNEIKSSNDWIAAAQTWVGYPALKDQTKIRRLITLLSERNEVATRVQKKMTNSEWLSAKDQEDIKKTDGDLEEINSLISELFGKVQGEMTIQEDSE